MRNNFSFFFFSILLFTKCKDNYHIIYSRLITNVRVVHVSVVVVVLSRLLTLQAGVNRVFLSFFDVERRYKLNIACFRIFRWLVLFNSFLVGRKFDLLSTYLHGGSDFHFLRLKLEFSVCSLLKSFSEFKGFAVSRKCYLSLVRVVRGFFVVFPFSLFPYVCLFIIYTVLLFV